MGIILKVISYIYIYINIFIPSAIQFYRFEGEIDPGQGRHNMMIFENVEKTKVSRPEASRRRFPAEKSIFSTF